MKLPRDEPAEIDPPTAEHLLAVHRLLPPRYRLPLLVLDATGMRSASSSADLGRRRRAARPLARLAGRRKTARKALWVEVPPVLFEASPRSCRATTAPRAARLPGVRRRPLPHRDRARLHRRRRAPFSPHDLRHRRISLLHLGGVPWARIGEHVGQRNLAVTANTYTHVLDRRGRARLRNDAQVTAHARRVLSLVLSAA